MCSLSFYPWINHNIAIKIKLQLIISRKLMFASRIHTWKNNRWRWQSTQCQLQYHKQYKWQEGRHGCKQKSNDTKIDSLVQYKNTYVRWAVCLVEWNFTKLSNNNNESTYLMDLIASLIHLSWSTLLKTQWSSS